MCSLSHATCIKLQHILRYLQASTLSLLQAVEDVVIDEGTFKYVLIHLEDRGSGAAKLIVRGHCDCGYHDDVLQKARREISGAGLDAKVRHCIRWQSAAHSNTHSS